jgi:hypothetical protein
MDNAWLSDSVGVQSSRATSRTAASRQVTRSSEAFDGDLSNAWPLILSYGPCRALQWPLLRNAAELAALLSASMAAWWTGQVCGGQAPSSQRRQM